MTTTETPTALNFDFNGVTPRMLVDFKKATGQSLMSLVDPETGFDMSTLSEECVAGIIMLALRMSGQPDATFEEALDTPLASLTLDEDEDELVDPTPAG